MQREAEERVREMQSRARLLANGNQSNFGQTAPNRPSPERPPQRQNSQQNQQSPAPLRQNPQSANPFGEISKVIGNVGEDKLIVLAVLWLLWNEHADNKLLLALLYLLL